MLDLKKLMQSFRTGISYSSRSLPELLEQEDSRFCREAVREDMFPADPCAALEKAGEKLLSQKKDQTLYRGFVQGLGTSDTQGQLEHIELYSVMLETHLEEAREDCDKKSRLYVSLGLFAGLTLCIVML